MSMDNKVHRIIIEEKSQEISENDLSITNKINNEILKTEDSISKYNSESKELDFKFNKIKLKLRGSLKIHSEKKIPIIRKTSYKENIKSMFSKEKKKSRNSNQITTTASSLEQNKKSEVVSLPKISNNPTSNSKPKINSYVFELSPGGKKNLKKTSTLKLDSKNRIHFSKEIIEGSPSSNKKEENNNEFNSTNNFTMKRFLKIKTFNHPNHKNKNRNQFINTKKNLEISIFNKDLAFLKYPTVKTSQHSINLFIKSFAVNSYQGLIRNYNEDKVSIILQVNKPKNYLGKYWPKISYLAIFDGHGGSTCSDYLRDNLHNYIIKNDFFPKDPEKSLLTGFEKCEKDFIENIALKQYEKSGSCALVCLIIDDILYCANCGDSRAIISLNSGKEIKLLNNIHRPSEENEKKRIIENGGRIYYSNNTIPRIKPGKLSVSRAFGDFNIKNEEFGGKKNVLISIPEISKISLNNNHIDFLIMGCDGIFEYLNNEECIKCAWTIIKENKQNYDNIHQMSGDIVDMIIKTSLKRHSLDNVTTVFVGFRNYAKIIQNHHLNVTTKNFTSSISQEKKTILGFNHIDEQINNNGKNGEKNTDCQNNENNNLLNQSVPYVKLKIVK